MGLVESLREKIINAPSAGTIEPRQNLLNSLTYKFVAGEISLSKLRQELSKLDENENTIVLPFPGPLYGLLRKVGVTSETATKKAYEERAHFAAAVENGLKTKIIIEPQKGVLSNERSLDIYFSYEIPEDISDEKFREIIREISLAPLRYDIELSPDDLAKLP